MVPARAGQYSTAVLQCKRMNKEEQERLKEMKRYIAEDIKRKRREKRLSLTELIRIAVREYKEKHPVLD